MSHSIKRHWLFTLLIVGISTWMGLLPATAEAAHKCKTCPQFCTLPQCVYCDACCRAQLEDYKAKMDLWIKYASDLKEKLQKCESETAKLLKEIGEVSAERDCFKSELESCHKKLKCAEDKIAALDCELAAARQQICLINQQWEACQGQLIATSTALTLANQDIEFKKIQINGLEIDLKSQRDAVSKLQPEVDKLKETLKTRDKELERSTIELEKSGIWILVLAFALIIVVLFLFCCVVIALLIIGRSERDAAVAYEKALGATREMAANKHDGCCKCAPSVVYGPGPVFADKTHAGTTPLHGGNTPNNGNPNNTDPNNGNPNNGNPNNGDPNNGNPNNADPNNANTSPNNSNPAPNNANTSPNNGNQSPNNSNPAPNNANPVPNNANPNSVGGVGGTPGAAVAGAGGGGGGGGGAGGSGGSGGGLLGGLLGGML